MSDNLPEWTIGLTTVLSVAVLCYHAAKIFVWNKDIKLVEDLDRRLVQALDLPRRPTGPVPPPVKPSGYAYTCPRCNACRWGSAKNFCPHCGRSFAKR